MDFGTLKRIADLEERIAAAEQELAVLREQSASAQAVADIAEQVASLSDWRDSQQKPTRSKLTLGNLIERRKEGHQVRTEAATDAKASASAGLALGGQG